ncbi:MAG: hypothetical protein AB1589_06515 [Cyanobacteriota bacterium]
MPTQKWREENLEKMRQYRRDWYSKNQEHAKEKVIERKNAINKWFKEIKRQLRCEKCGEDHPACLEFHHLNPSEKKINLSEAVAIKGWSKNKILDEIDKCVVLCSNCHKKLHWELQQQVVSEGINKKVVHLKARKVERPSKEELEKMIWETSVSEVARKFGVSNVAVAKWCKSYGISRPPRGYWAKKNQSKNFSS